MRTTHQEVEVRESTDSNIQLHQSLLLSKNQREIYNTFTEQIINKKRAGKNSRAAATLQITQCLSSEPVSEEKAKRRDELLPASPK